MGGGEVVGVELGGVKVQSFFSFSSSVRDLEDGGLYDSGGRWMDVPYGEMLVRDLRERSRGQGSPDIAVPAKLDQFFICDFMLVLLQATRL